MVVLKSSLWHTFVACATSRKLVFESLSGVFVVGIVLQPLGEVAFWAVSVVAACALQEFVRFVQKRFVVR